MSAWRKITESGVRRAGIAAALALGAALPARGADSVGALEQKGNAFYKQERLDDAIGAYRDAIARDPQSPLIQYNLGTALSRDQRYDEAEQVLGQAARTPSAFCGDASFNLGVTRAESVLKDHPQVQKFLQASPSTDAPIPPQLAAAIEPKGVKESIDKLGDALQSFRQTLTKTAGNSEAKYNYEVTRQMIERLKQLQQVQQQQQQQQQQQNQQQNQQQQQQKNQQDQNQNKDENQKDPNQQNQQQQNQDSSKNQNPSKNPQRGQSKPDDKPNQDKPEDKSQGQGGLEKKPTPTPTPAPTPDPSQGNPQEGKSNDQGNSGQNPGAEGQEGEASEKPPMTSDQMDALRLLQLLEGDKPEQFKKLFQFHGKVRDHSAGKDW